MDSLAQALQGGLQKIADAKPSEDGGDELALFKEYKSAESEEDKLRALKQLIKLAK